MKLDPDDYDRIAGAFFEMEGREPSAEEVNEIFNNEIAAKADWLHDWQKEQAYYGTP